MSPSLLSALPTVNSALNGTSAILLLTDYLFSRGGARSWRESNVFVTGWVG